jgi:hypothetical protein
MRATEIIRNMLDLFDNPSPPCDQEPKTTIIVARPVTTNPVQDDTETMARYRQIVDLLPDHNDDKTFVNSIDEKYADIESVLTSGTDLQKSKNPADIRTDAVSMYPNAQWNGR